jgi:SdrD B-like domain
MSRVSHRLGLLLTSLGVSTFAMGAYGPGNANAAPAGTVGHISLATQKTPTVATGLQDGTVTASIYPLRTSKAISLKTSAEGASDKVIAYDDVTGSISGVAYVAASISPTGAELFVTAPKTAPLTRQSPNGPGAITTVNAAGQAVATQYVPRVLPGPAGCVHNWGDGTATSYKTAMVSYIIADTAVSDCSTPIGKVGESVAPGDNVVDATSVVGIGDVVLSDDGKNIIAANANDGHLYTGPLLGSGELTKITSLAAFANSPEWRPYGLSNHNGQTLVAFTQLDKLGSLDPQQFAVASYDSVKDAWKTVMEPTSAAGVVIENPSATTAATKPLPLRNSILSGVSIDSNGSLQVTFLNIVQASRPPSAGVGSTPVLTLAADGIDHWNNDLKTAPVVDVGALALDHSNVPSFGHLVRSPIANKTVLGTGDPGAYNASGLAWLPDAKPDSGTSQILSARSGVADANDNLWIGSVQTADPADPYAFGKGAGLGQISDMANYAEIGDRTWIDTDRNGLQDIGEPSLPGVALEVLNGNGAPVVDPATGAPAVVITDANGRYTIVVDAGVKVQVCIAASNYAPGGVFGGSGSNPGYVLTKPLAGTDVSIDSNGDPDTKCLLAKGGQSFTPGTRNYTFDAGFVPAIPPTPLPTVPSVLPNTVSPPATIPGTLPATGTLTRTPLTLAISLSLVGAALIIIDRLRKACPPAPAEQPDRR